MSIVPYANNKIVLHDPNHGLLVLHNNEDNLIELVSTLRNDYDDTSSNTQRPELACPNCGYKWSPQLTRRRRSSQTRESSTANTDHRVQISALPGLSQVSSAFMDHDYFKLLEKLPYKARPIDDDGSSMSSLPANIFNQGYFKRFFKQVPPYTLGLGAHAQVYKVIHVLNEIVLGTYAVKRISMGNQLKYLELVLNEVLILYELSVKGAYEHNLIRYNHVWLEMGDFGDLQTIFLPHESAAMNSSSSKVPYVFILQQYCDGGHLERLMRDNFQQEYNLSAKERVERERARRRSIRKGTKEEKKQKKDWLTELEVWKFFKDISTAVNYLHHHNILHRDLKPSNCLLDVKYTANVLTVPVLLSSQEFEDSCEALPKILVSDFGEGKFINKHNVTEEKLRFQDEERRGNTGTLEFTAPELWLFTIYDPEVIKNNPNCNSSPPRHTYESDIYSLGLILCWLCVGALPFSHLIEQETDPQIIRQKILDWYFTLTEELFHEWYAQNCKLEQSGCLQDFSVLIFAMIKGSDKKDDPSRLLSSDVLKYLENMKKEWFLAPNSIETDEELSDDEQLHNLTVEEIPLQPKVKTQHFISSLGSGSYFLDILLLQSICMYRPHQYLNGATLLVVIVFGLEVLYTPRLGIKRITQWLAFIVSVLVAISILSSRI